MSKRRPAFDIGQLSLDFEVSHHASGDGALAGLERETASAVGQILKADPRSRFEVAGGISAMLDDEVSKLMLDAYAAEARESHNISFARMLALIAETQRYDVLDGLLKRIGCKVVVGEEILTVELGHIEAQMDRLRQRQAVLKRVAPEIQPRRRGGRNK